MFKDEKKKLKMLKKLKIQKMLKMFKNVTNSKMLPTNRRTNGPTDQGVESGPRD